MSWTEGTTAGRDGGGGWWERAPEFGGTPSSLEGDCKWRAHSSTQSPYMEAQNKIAQTRARLGCPHYGLGTRGDVPDDDSDATAGAGRTVLVVRTGERDA